jgi:hypothetical protein
MIITAMSQESSLQTSIPAEFTQEHHDALMTYIIDSRNLNTAVWRQLYRGIDLLDAAQIGSANQTRTFRQVYEEHIGRPLADQFIEQLLEANDVSIESPRITAAFARQVRPILQKAGFLRHNDPYSVILQAYCLYWWQSFARGYAFEVTIMRDLIASGIDIQMHDIRNRLARLSPADLIVLDLLGDIKSSIYFLQEQSQLPNDFYITRLYEKGQERTLVVFQKPNAWDVIDGGTTILGSLEEILNLLPGPIQIRHLGIILIVVDYETWKQLVRQKQTG